MTMTFLRDYEIDFTSSPPVPNEYVSLFPHAVRLPSPISISGLTKFKMTANIKSSPNGENIVSTIMLYNIGEDYMEAINTVGDKTIVLRTRYEIEGGGVGTFKEIYRGAIIGVETKLNRNDVITVIHCNPAVAALSRQVTNRVVTVGENAYTIISRLAADAGIELIWSVAGGQGLVVKKDYTLDAKVSDAVQQICDKNGYNFYYGKEGLTITSSVDNTTGRIFTIPPEMVKGYPEIKQDFTSDGTSVTGKDPQVRVRAFVFGDISIGDHARVTVFQPYGKTKNVRFKIESYQYILDSLDGDNWDCIMEGAQV